MKRAFIGEFHVTKKINLEHMKIYNYILSSVLALLLLSCSQSPLKIDTTLCENKVNPLGVNTENIRFSWIVKSNIRDNGQSAYQIIIASSIEKLKADNGDIWNSGKKESDQSILIPFNEQTLQAGTTYFWKVKIWDTKGNESSWSEPSKFVTGLIQPQDWSNAQWIAYDEMDSSKRIVPGIHAPNYSKVWKKYPSGEHILPILRKEFNSDKKVASAYAFISGLGHYEMNINGQKVGNSFLAPGWTNYDSTCFYNTYDIKEYLQNGSNAIGVWLGNGFYNVPNKRYRKLLIAYGHPKMICKVVVNYEDGTSETITSDQSWKTAPSPITFSSIYSGEDYNANLEQEGWNNANFDDSQWNNAIITHNPAKLTSEMDYPLFIEQAIDTKTIHTVDKEAVQYTYDFGQNASGIIRLQIKGNKGDTVRFYPGELINEEMKVTQGSTGKPYIFTYILKGDGIEEWTPKFTFYGFRYVTVDGAVPASETQTEGHPQIVKLELLHNRNSSPQTGEFHSSYELFNQVNSLIKWAIKSNMQSVLSDCPHREKLGWLEQSFLMGGGVHYNFDIYHLYCKMIDDMIEAQTPEGLVPTITPEYTVFEFANGDFRDSPEWGSASIILPWLMYEWYGDETQMEKAWPMMTRYAAYLKAKSKNHILDHGLGDWYDLGPGSPGYAQLTPRSLTATAIYYYDVHLLRQMAQMLHKKEDAKLYAQWANEIKETFNKEFYNPETKIYATGSQTAIAMPLELGLVDEADKKAVFNTLVESIKNSDLALTAGDIGFHYMIKALQDNNAGDLIFKMNARDDVPGYGFQLKKGATALTESWQALERVSNNHLMLGHIMEWFYEGLGGIKQADNSVAYKNLVIAPQIIDEINHNEVSFETPYGLAVSKWSKDEKQVTMEVSIPFNSTAQIHFPTAYINQISLDGKNVSQYPELKSVKTSDGNIVMEAGSGKYTFVIQR